VRRIVNVVVVVMDQDRPRATAANGTQWSGARACSEPTVMAPMRRVRNMVSPLYSRHCSRFT
jgi:hypothetical protein